jgi:hypothetical protein
MFLMSPSAGVRCALCLALAGAGARLAWAQGAGPKDFAINEEPGRTARYRPFSPQPPGARSQHPLGRVLQYALDEQLYMRQTVRDFTCRLVKRERIDGILQDYQHIELRVREEVRVGNQVVKPQSIFMDYLGPRRVAGRKVLFVAGQNDGKMLVRNGGKHFDYVVVKIDPYGPRALEESLVPITRSGFNHMLGQMIEVLQRDAQADASGKNTRVEFLTRAKLNQRPCSVIRITHPENRGGLGFHVANVFIDDELHVPVRVDFSEWPNLASQPPPLVAEYTYTDLKLNVDLSDAAFDRALVRGTR